MRADLLITNTSRVLTLAGAVPRTGPAMTDLGEVERGAIAVRDGRVAAVGPAGEIERQVEPGLVLDAGGRLALPGFVDAHTHLVFAGHRAEEWEMRLRGATYQEIASAGGGILGTVRATRAASLADLVASGLRRLDVMLAHGTTTVEAKSGYGLEPETELRQLRAIAELGRRHPLHLVPTFLGAHAVPAGTDADAYVEQVVGEMIPAVSGERLAEFCDVFAEVGAFSIAQAERVLRAGLAHGLRPKIHADELSDLGGAELAARLRAASADHLLWVGAGGVRAMAEAGVAAVLLPGTAFFLMADRRAPARALLEAGVAVALGTDCNPGSSPTLSMPMAISLACVEMQMTAAEAICAATLNAAWAVGRAGDVGSLAAGKRADVVLVEAEDHREFPMAFGTNLVHAVVVDGRVAYRSDRGHVWRSP